MGKESVRSRVTQLQEWLKTTKNYKQKQASRRKATKNNQTQKW